MGARGPKPGCPKPKGSGRKPGSKNKLAPEVKTLAQKHGASAIDYLGELLNDPMQAPEARIKAAQELLNRGYGRSVGETRLAGHDGGPLDFSSMPADQLEGWILRLAEMAKTNKEEPTIQH
jgi:hypothetical protein